MMQVTTVTLELRIRSGYRCEEGAGPSAFRINVPDRRAANPITDPHEQEVLRSYRSAFDIRG